MHKLLRDTLSLKSKKNLIGTYEKLTERGASLDVKERCERLYIQKTLREARLLHF